MCSNLQKLWIYCIVVIIHVVVRINSENYIDNKIKIHNVRTSSLEGEKTTFLHFKQLHHAVKECVKLNHSVWNCMKEQTITIFRKLMSAPIIPLCNGISFVRIFNDNTSNGNGFFVDHKSERKDFKYLTWFDRLSMILAQTFNTHKLQINLKEIADTYLRANSNDTNNTSNDVGEGRMRRHRYNMLITMMFGATALGAILVPMGFQLLSIVSGKALLMAKMALLLASINGLKRVANSGVHYGLYHVPGEHFAGYYDRGDVHHPRNVAPGIAFTQPIDVGI